VASDDDFASLLRASMQSTDDRATRRLAAGELVEARVIQIGADSVFVDVGTTGDGRIERAEFEQGVGAPPLEVGATIRATVVHPNPSAPVLTLALGRGSSVDQAALRAAWESGVPVVGRVQSVVKAGLEVDFGGIRAFCPASQIDVAYVAELGVFEGQELEFRVVEIRDGGRSVVVSRRALLEEQRQARQKALVEQLSVGGEVEGVVHAIQRHGVVVDLGGIEGFVHISEIAHHHVQRIEDELNVGDAVRASVVSIEETSRGVRVRLSLKALVQAPTQPRPPALDEVLDGEGRRAGTGRPARSSPWRRSPAGISRGQVGPGGSHQSGRHHGQASLQHFRRGQGGRAPQLS
jgi:small subunit ribosomal protein S1